MAKEKVSHKHGFTQIDLDRVDNVDFKPLSLVDSQKKKKNDPDTFVACKSSDIQVKKDPNRRTSTKPDHVKIIPEIVIKESPTQNDQYVNESFEKDGKECIEEAADLSSECGCDECTDMANQSAQVSNVDTNSNGDNSSVVDTSDNESEKEEDHSQKFVNTKQANDSQVENFKLDTSTRKEKDSSKSNVSIRKYSSIYNSVQFQTKPKLVSKKRNFNSSKSKYSYQKRSFAQNDRKSDNRNGLFTCPLGRCDLTFRDK